jgi:wobble nucleotide-excising tRNase
LKITRIHRLRDYRIFRDFSWPVNGLPDFARFNVIYGWNGTGKTSLSSLFRQMQRREPVLDGDVEVVIEQTRIAGSTFETATIPGMRVFNRDAIDRNVFEVANQQLPPVYFLGEDSVEKQKQIEHLKEQAATLSTEQLQLESKKIAATTELEGYCTDQARSIKNLLTVAGGGPYNNYDARNFKNTVQRIASTNPLPQPLTVELREKYLSTKDGRSIERISSLQVKYPDFNDLTTRTQRALGHSVLSRVLPELSENPEIATWVSAGMDLHTGQNVTSKCRFCDQTLPPDRLKHLEAHFNDEFKRFQQEINSLINEIVHARTVVAGLQLPSKSVFYPHLQAEVEKATSTLSQQVVIVRAYLDTLLKALNAKKEDPFKHHDLQPYLTGHDSSSEPTSTLVLIFQAVMVGGTALSMAVGKAAFDKINALATDHNRHTDNFDKEVSQSRVALEEDEILKAVAEWRSRGQAVKSAEAELETVRIKTVSTQAEIVELEMQVLQHRRPAEELNREMADYLGRDELRFEVEQNGYRITRNSYPATHLSEGERTAIAFMYFLKSLAANDFDLKTGVVVIDDPVSSLDANSLYSAFGFMKQRTAEAGQLFVLTHNFTFFRLVRNWFYNLRGQDKKNWRMYMLNSIYTGGQRAAIIEVLDPFLHEYESEYHYLFKCVYQEAQRPKGQGLETYYAAPNIARRLLESFLAFRVPDVAGDLFHKLDAIHFDTAKKTRILRFLHTYSHFDQVAEPGHDASVLSEAPAILRDVLELIEVTDKTHYDRMIAKIAPPAAEVN